VGKNSFLFFYLFFNGKGRFAFSLGLVDLDPLEPFWFSPLSFSKSMVNW